MPMTITDPSQTSFTLLRLWYKEDIRDVKESIITCKGWLKKYHWMPQADKQIMEDSLFWCEQELLHLEMGLNMMAAEKDHYHYNF